MDKLNEQLYCAEQITYQDIKNAALNGIEMVICNRPDGESEDQPSHEEVAEWCIQNNLVYIYQPVISGKITALDVSTFGQYITPYQRVLAYCRSGTRCSILWGAHQIAQGTMDIATVKEIIENTGRQIGAAEQLFSELEKSRIK